MLQRVRHRIHFGPRNSGLSVDLFCSFAGAGLPGLIAAVTIPPLLHEAGMDRFGVPSLADLSGFASASGLNKNAPS